MNECRERECFSNIIIVYDYRSPRCSCGKIYLIHKYNNKYLKRRFHKRPWSSSFPNVAQNIKYISYPLTHIWRKRGRLPHLNKVGDI